MLELHRHTARPTPRSSGPGFPNIRWAIVTAGAITTLICTSQRASCAPVDAPAAQQSGNDAQVDVQKRVTELMRAGVDAYRAGNLEEARVAFEEAWKLKPHAAIAGSLADVEMKLGRYREAATHWRYYVGRSPPDRAAAVQQLEECLKHVGRVRVSVNAAGAALFLDGEPIGSAPLEDELLVDSGDHIVSARLNARTSPDRSFSIGAGELQTVDITLPESSQPAATASRIAQGKDDTTTPARDASGVTARTVVVVAGSVLTVSAAALGVVYLVDANNAEANANRLRAETLQSGDAAAASRNGQCAADAMPRPAACDALGRAVSDSDTSRNIAIGAFVTAGVLGLATAAAFVFWPSDEHGAHSAITVGPWLQAHSQGFVLEGRF
jgi:tetratricopeptide (TPR) repeat protein